MCVAWSGGWPRNRPRVFHGEGDGMRVALARELGGIDSVELGDRPDPPPAAGQVLVRVHGAGVGPWDVGFLSGGFTGVALPFVPGQEIAGAAEAVGDGAAFAPGDRVWGGRTAAGLFGWGGPGPG